MKNLIILITTCIFLISCSSSSGNDDFMEDVLNSNDMEMMNDANYSMGDFVALAHPTSGMASINSDKSILTFKGFKTDDGPKLLVYLSSDNNATEYVDLGELKGIEGDFTYAIPTDTDVDNLNIVNIWCVDFSVSFGVAELKKNE